MTGSLYNSENLGRNQFYFWYGMVVGGKEWEDNQKDAANKAHKVHKRDDVAGWGYRCKVAILGYDPHLVDDKGVKNSELVMAEVMLPTTGGGGIGGPVVTPSIGNNSFVVGFFKDGIAAREPVIMGVLPNISQSRVKEYDFPETTRYIASTGYRPGEDKVANDAFWGEGPSSSSPVMETADMVRPYTVLLKAQLDDGLRSFALPSTFGCERKCGGSTNKIQGAIQELVNILGLSKAADWASKTSDALKNYGAIVSNTINIVTAEMQKFVQDMRSKVLNAVNGVVDGVLDSIIPPNSRGKEVDKKTNKLLDGITCAFNFIIKRLRGIVAKFIKNLIAGAFDIATSTAQSLIGCVLTNILGTITSAVGAALGALGNLLGSAVSLVGGVFNALNILAGSLNIFSCKEELQCAAINSWSWLYGDGSTSGCGGGGLPGLFGLAGAFESNVNSAIDSVSSVVDSASNLGSGLEGALGCLNLTQGTQPLLAGPPLVATSGGGPVSSSGGTGTAGGTGGTGTAGGTGFIANPVISPKGEILALDIINGGSGYTSPPNIIIYDPAGKGRGAVAIPLMKGGRSSPFDKDGCGRSEINQKYPNIKENYPPLSSRNEKDLSDENNRTEYIGGGPLQDRPEIKLTPSIIPLSDTPPVTGQSIDKVVILDSGVGYLQKPDGSTGAGGRTVSNPEDSIVYCGGYNVYPPCSNVQVFENDLIYLPLGTTGQIFDSDGNLIQSSTGLGPTSPIKVIKTGTLATPCVTRDEVLPIVPELPTVLASNKSSALNASDESGILPTTNVPNQYQVALEIGDVYIEDIGINYSPNDIITIEPANGAELKPKYDEVGRLIDVEIVNPGIGFTEIPEIRIYSNTGYNANIIPIFNVIRVTDEVLDRDIVPAGTPLVSVIDCVGVQPPKREFEIIPQ